MFANICCKVPFTDVCARQSPLSGRFWTMVCPLNLEGLGLEV